MPTLQTLIDRTKAKTLRSLRVGWFDHSNDGHDMRLVTAKAFRLLMRLRGERITLRAALWG